MPDLPPGADHNGTYCFPVGQTNDRALRFVPGQPTTADPRGTSTVKVTDTDPSAVAMTVRWPADAADVNAAAALVVEAYAPWAGLTPTRAQLADVSVFAEVRQEGRVIATLGPQPASGIGEQSAALFGTLDTDAVARVQAALDGEPGAVLINVVGTLSLTARCDGTLSGNASALLADLAPHKKPGLFSHGTTPPPTRKQVDDAVAAAVADGSLEVALDASPDASDELRQRVTDDLTAQASQHLASTIDQLGPDAATFTDYSLSVRSGASETHDYPISRNLDLGASPARR